MKTKILYIILVIGSLAYSQKHSIIDSTDIALKANLLSISRYNLKADSLQLVELLTQKVDFMNSVEEDFVFIKIKSNQTYSKITLNQEPFQIPFNCYFYLAYNKKDKIFYRLGGFDTNDIENLFNDMDEYFYSYRVDDSFKEKLNWKCLENYRKNVLRRQVKKLKKCFTNCHELVNSTISIE